MVHHGYVGALQCDPIEKKPFFHAAPGSLALTFGMLGCDYHCPYCQNWLTSQALRDPDAIAPPTRVSASELVGLARRHGARMVASSYNEPLITSEWAVEVFREARAAGFLTGYISNGNGTPEVLRYLRPWVDCYKVDLKSMSDKNYRELGGKLQNVIDTIRLLVELDFWVEIVTLIVPGFNDSDEELREAARFLASLSPDIPWHVTAFHKDYKLTDPDNTSAVKLLRAAEIGREEGLRYVYAGNLPGMVGEWEHTRCSNCGATLIERCGFRVVAYRLTDDGRCPECAAPIPGVWEGARIPRGAERQ
jgi:pyruvate formate lyase activating enzyme